MGQSAVPPEAPMVLREQLPLPRPYAAPRTSTEQRLADIWRTVLSMDRVGVHDSYHDLGGDSFLAAIMFGMIEETFHVSVPMAILVTASTIAELGLALDELTKV
jgi:acyl carrier protein